MKHTPGPWKAHFDGAGTPFYKYNQYVTAPNRAGELIAKVQNMEEAEANTYLIASAPELLEFCYAVAQGPYKDSDLGSLLETYQAIAKNLIAKAEG
jgi:hypothetical protein